MSMLQLVPIWRFGPDGAVWIGDGLALGDLAHQHLARPGEPHHRGGGPAAFGVGQDGRLTRLHDADDGVGGAEVDADGLGHETCLRMLDSISMTRTSIAKLSLMISSPLVGVRGTGLVAPAGGYSRRP